MSKENRINKFKKDFKKQFTSKKKMGEKRNTLALFRQKLASKSNLSRLQIS